MPNALAQLKCQEGFLLPELHYLYMPPETLPGILLAKLDSHGLNGCKVSRQSEMKSAAADVPGCKHHASAMHLPFQPGLPEIEQDTQHCNGWPAINCKRQ